MGIQKKTKLVSLRFQYLILNYNLLKILLIAFLFCNRASAFNEESINKPCSPNVDGNNVKYQNTTLTLKILLVEFPDIKHSTNPVYTTQNWNDLFFSKGTYYSPNKKSPDGQAVFGSVNDYYNKMSNNNLEITGKIINKDADEDGIPEWIKLKHSKSDYNTIYQLDIISDALAGAAAENLDIDLTKPNTILVIIYSGMVIREAPYLLSPHIGSEKNTYIMGEKFAPFAPYNDHRNDAKFSHIGIHVHELAHCIGLWDLYCNDIKHNNDNGVWDLMASGTYNGPDWSGECPAPINPEMRNRKGWIEFKTIYENPETSIKFSYNLENPSVYKLANVKKNEYFLFEERKFNSMMKAGNFFVPDYNTCIPYLVGNGINKGILIWRVSSYSPGGQIIHASGKNWTDGKNPPWDVFPGLANVRVFNPWSSTLKYNDYYWAPLSFPSLDIGMEIVNEDEDCFNVNLYSSIPILSSPSRPRNITLKVDSLSNRIKILWSYSDEPDMQRSMGGIYEVSRIDLKKDTAWKIITLTESNTYIDHQYFYNRSPIDYYCKYRVRGRDGQDLWSTYSDEITRISGAIDTTIIVFPDTSKQDTSKTTSKTNVFISSFSNYPNPFNNSTIIYFLLQKDTRVKLRLFDLLGRELTTLLNETKKKGTYNIPVNFSNYPAGVYILKLETAESSYSRKLLYIK